jgi:hypothetical protein
LVLSFDEIIVHTIYEGKKERKKEGMCLKKACKGGREKERTK